MGPFFRNGSILLLFLDLHVQDLSCYLLPNAFHVCERLFIFGTPLSFFLSLSLEITETICGFLGLFWTLCGHLPDRGTPGPQAPGGGINSDIGRVWDIGRVGVREYLISYWRGVIVSRNRLSISDGIDKILCVMVITESMNSL